MPKTKEPPQLVQGSFKHKIHMTELYAKTYEFKLRTLTLTRETKRDSIGFTVRQGDGWSRTDGIFVSRIQFGSTIDICNLISVGDEIIKIDDKEVNDADIAKNIQHIYDTLSLTITLKIPTPFAKKRAGIRWRKLNEPPMSRVEDYKVLNMRLPKKERHVCEEAKEEEQGETQPEAE